MSGEPIRELTDCSTCGGSGVFDLSRQRCLKADCMSHVWREERTCKRCRTEYPLGQTAGNSPCPNRECWLASEAEKREMARLQLEQRNLRQTEAAAALDAAYVAHTAHSRRAALVWEAMKQNPTASFDDMLELADRFITWDIEQMATIDGAITTARQTLHSTGTPDDCSLPTRR